LESVPEISIPDIKEENSNNSHLEEYFEDEEALIIYYACSLQK
jgi:hypothetical protein